MPDDAELDEQIVLTVPATGDHASIIRVAAASLALRLDTPISRIDDLRLAIDEAMILLLTSAADAATLRAILRVTSEELSVELSPDERATIDISEDATDRFVKISAGLVDDWAIDDTAPCVRIVQRVAAS